MSSIKKIIIILSIVLLIIVVILLVIKKKENSNKLPYQGESKEKEEERIKFTTETNLDIALLKSKMDYLNIINCIKQFKNAENSVLDSEDSNNSKELYALLDKEYLDYNKIKNSNIIDFFKTNYTKTEFYIDSIYQKKVNEKYFIYFVYGRERNLETNEISNSAYIMKENLPDKLFSIIPYDYIKENGLDDINNKNSFNIEKLETEDLEANGYNTFKFTIANDETVAKTYLEHYLKNLKYDTEFLYKSLDEEYREKRFKNYKGFKQYIDENMEELSNINLIQYQFVTFDTKNLYVLVDQYNNTYTFESDGFTNYKLFLDEYTVELPGFIENYDSSNEKTKAAMNVKRFIQSLCQKDYSYAYSHLDDEFKKNNFDTLENFTNYIKEHLNNKVQISFINYTNEGLIHIYDIKLLSLESRNDPDIEMQIVMKLKENRDFVMSFSIK